MVTPVNVSAQSYYNLIDPYATASTTTPATAPASTTGTTSSTASAADPAYTLSPVVQSLLDGLIPGNTDSSGTATSGADLISALLNNSTNNSSGDLTSALLGASTPASRTSGAPENEVLAGVYTSLLNAAYAGAAAKASQQAISNDPIDNVISSFNAAHGYTTTAPAAPADSTTGGTSSS